MPSLSDVKIRVERASDKPRKVFDGDGLFLLISPGGSKLWRFKYRIDGREKLLSFGSYPEVSLKQARDRLADARRAVAAKIDPSLQRKAERLSQAHTFAAVAREWLELQKPKLAAVSHKKASWLLEDLLFPAIGSSQIKSVGAPELLAALRKIEARGRHETAHRARQTAGSVFRYAIVTGRADRDISADLRGALAPVVTTNRAVVTQPARVGELLRAIDCYAGQPATRVALHLAALVFVRPGELRGAVWEEFEIEGPEPVWRIPGERMKMGLEHLVPLAPQVLSLLDELRPIVGEKGLLFPSLRSGARPISENTLNAALRRMGYAKDEMTAHGFRAIASTMLNELGCSPDLIELQLAHTERDKVRGAYNRAQRLAERHHMMRQWAEYLDSLKANERNGSLASGTSRGSPRALTGQ
jgi:integrase